MFPDVLMWEIWDTNQVLGGGLNTSLGFGLSISISEDSRKNYWDSKHRATYNSKCKLLQLSLERSRRCRKPERKIKLILTPGNRQAQNLLALALNFGKQGCEFHFSKLVLSHVCWRALLSVQVRITWGSCRAEGLLLLPLVLTQTNEHLPSLEAWSFHKTSEDWTCFNQNVKEHTVFCICLILFFALQACYRFTFS